jgi:hypothetical protein
MAEMTCAKLLEVVYWFYPRGLDVGGLGYEDTEQRQRQWDAARRGVAECPTWKAMLRRLDARYKLLVDQSEHLLSGRYDPAYSAEICIPGRRLGFHVSLLGPYYGIHRTGAPGEELPALDLAREIEATYPGYAPIPPEIGNEIVPDVALDGRYFGTAPIYECLLSGVWEYSSGPWPPPPRPPVSAAHVPQPALAVLLATGKKILVGGRPVGGAGAVTDLAGVEVLQRGDRPDDDDREPDDHEPPEPGDRRG